MFSWCSFYFSWEKIGKCHPKLLLNTRICVYLPKFCLRSIFLVFVNWCAPTISVKQVMKRLTELTRLFKHLSHAMQKEPMQTVNDDLVCNIFLILFNLYHSLGIFSRRQIDDIFLIFPRKQDLTFHANCLLRRQFACNVKSCFLGKIRKIFQNVVCWKFYPEC